MKLKHIVVGGLTLIGLYIAVHWLFTHGGSAKISGMMGGSSAYAGAGFGGTP